MQLVINLGPLDRGTASAVAYEIASSLWDDLVVTGLPD